MNFKAWINQKYIDYLQQQGEHRSVTEFAHWVGTSQSTMNAWINGYRVPNRQKTVELLIKKFGIEAQEILGTFEPRSDYRVLSEAPSDVRKRLTAAISDANQQYRAAADRGLDLSDEQAEHILREAMSKYGFFSNETGISNPPE